MYSILIADSGASKTDWCLIDKESNTTFYQTKGMHPFFRTKEECLKILNDELNIDQSTAQVEEVFFYGAGIKGKIQSDFIKEIIEQHFSIKKINVQSDMLAAAHASCANKEGICCILGTGSNSCYYDGNIIAAKNPSLGFIVGDEASGTYYGKKVLQYYFYNTFDDDLQDAFRNQYGDDLNEILQSIYTRPQPNRYLASFAEFLINNRGHYMVENIIEDGLIEFHQKHVLKYRESWKNPIHFVGGIAYSFKDVIVNLHHQYGLETGNIIKKPIDNLVEIYKNDSYQFIRNQDVFFS